MKKSIYLYVMAVCFTTTVFAQKNIKETIVITNFVVYEKDNQLVFKWSTNGTVATNVWKVQRSTNKVQFSTIAIVLGNKPGEEGDNYIYKKKPELKKDIKFYYRVCHTNAKNIEQFSKILTPAK